jgi:hypothetical protein
VAHADVERKVVVSLPDQAHEARDRLGLALLQRFLRRNELGPRNVGQGSSGSAGTVSGDFRCLVACS